MQNDQQKKQTSVSPEETVKQVRLMARRMALLYHHIAEVLVEEYGGGEAKRLLEEAVWRYGAECGNDVRKRVTKLGLPLTVENYGAVPDLPSYGWETEETEAGLMVTHCPLATVWLEKGSEHLGRIYCTVDQAKYEAYNGAECIHVKNVLDGDEGCLFAFREEAS